MKYKFIFIIFLLTSFSLLSQEYEDPHAYLDWKQIETKHFFINFHPGTENTAKVLAKIAEEVYPAITSIYNHEPDTKVSLIIKDYGDYSNGASYYYDNKIEIWATALDFDLRGTHNWLRNVFTHEFTHLIQLQTSMKFGRKVPAFYLQWMNYESERRPDVLYGFPNVLVSYPIPGTSIPAWFAEGVAQYNNPDLKYDYWDSHRDMILRMYALSDSLLSWGDMGTFGKNSLGNESSYNAGFSLIQYISDKYGFDKVRDISYQMSSPLQFNLDGAIEKVLGKTGIELYNEWKYYIIHDYKRRTETIAKNVVTGKIIASEGFANFYPVFSPDNKKIVYTSNKKFDYFSWSSLYLYDIETKKEEQIKFGVKSELSFSQDGNLIYYSKLNSPNTRDESYYDIYCYNINKKEERRITENLRAYAPSVSNDGNKIVFLSQIDGTVNIYYFDIKDNKITQLTSYKNHEQLYSPKWSNDGKKIIYCYSQKDERDIYLLDVDSRNIEPLIKNGHDNRNPVFSKDGKYIYFSSNLTGIFNIFKYDLQTNLLEQLTNVLGGAFMPSVNDSGDIVYSLYHFGGFKIALIKQPNPISKEKCEYLRREEVKKALLNKWTFLNNFDDSNVEEHNSRNYNNVFGSLSFFPMIRLDNYNKHNKFIDNIKPGVYISSSDVLDKYGFFAGGSINLKMERDLFLIFDYKDKLPLLYDLGLTPQLTLELYNITRTTDNQIELPLYNIPVEVTYNMFEFDVSATHKIFNADTYLKLLFRYSRYGSSVSSFYLPEVNQLVPASSDYYLHGVDFGLDFSTKNIIPSRTSAINPIGRKFHFKFDYEMNSFNSKGEYKIEDGLLKPVYDDYKFPKIELKYIESFPLPGWMHTLTFELHTASILGPKVDEFFNYYIGGFSGMKGYTFYGLGGNEVARINLSYRFPIIDGIDLKLAHVYFDKLYASVFFDYGNAWMDKTSLKDFKKDIGFELRLETFSFYMYPTRIFLSTAYGLDEFSNIYNKKLINFGKEWKFYLGILFGFDIFDIN